MTELDFLHRVEESCFEPVRIVRGNNWALLHFAHVTVEYVYGSDVIRVKMSSPLRWKSRFDDGPFDGLACHTSREWNRDYLMVDEWDSLQRLLSNDYYH